MASDAQILEASRTRLLEIIQGGVSEFWEGGERARLLEIDRLEKLIEKYEARVANAEAPLLRPLRTGAL